MKEKILIIEDEPLIRNELKTLQQSNGYETAAPEDFSDVIDRIRAEQPHLILLDIKLPGTSGFSLCTEVRTFSELPIIFVTSCNTDMDELNSIMLGGDAFITKPYNTAILLAKIASLLKKAYPAQQREQIVYGDVVLHLESSSLDYHGHSVELTKNELKILYYLFKNGGKIYEKTYYVMAWYSGNSDCNGDRLFSGEGYSRERKCRNNGTIGKVYGTRNRAVFRIPYGVTCRYGI